MTDAISRLGVVVEEKGIQETLRGLDKLIVMMEKAEKKASSPVAFSVDTRQLDKAADRQIALAEKQKAADQSLARAKEKQETYTTEVRNREAEKRRTIAENEANRQLTVEAKSSAAREQLVSQFEERRKTYTSKINDDIQKISEKSEKELAKIRLDADSKVRVARETSLQRIEEAEKRSASSVSAIHQKEREKRITDNARAEQRMSLEVQKASSKSEQLAERSNAQIMAIRERTAAFSEKMHLREQAAAERSLKAQQQGMTSLHALSQGLQSIMTVGFAGFGLQQVVTDLIKAADSMTELSARLRLVTSTSGELNYVQQELYKNSQLAGTRIKDNTEIYFGLARSTRTLNVSQKDLISLTDGLGKAAIVSGASTESYKSAMVQLRQALESGVLRGQEFNSVNEQAPRIMQAIAEGLGKTTGELRKMAGEGKLTTDVVIPALKTGLAKVNEEYDKLPKTVSRGWNTIENSFLNWIDRANKATQSTATLSSGMFSLAESMDKVSGESIISSLNGIATAAMVVAGVFTSRLIGSFIAARKEQLLGIVANIEKVNSDKLTTASAVRVAEQNVVTAKTEMDRANATLLAAERDLAAVAAADMLVLATGRLSAAKEAVAIASANQAKASTAVAAAEAEAAIATNAATVAAERHAAAATASGLAMRGLGSIFTALGGWVTVAIGVIWGLVTIWDKVANAAENAAQKQKDALEAAKRAQTREDVNTLEKDARAKYEMYSKSASSAEIDLKAMSKSDPGYARQQEIVDNFKTQARGWSQTLTQIENVGRERTATLTKQVESSLDAARSPAQVADAFVEGAKHLSKADKSTKDIQEIITRRDAAIRSIRQSISVEDKRNQVKDPASVIEAEKKIRLSAEKEIQAVKEKGKGKGAARTPRPELSAGYEEVVSSAKEELELLNKLGAAQEKLLGYVTPEIIQRKQAVEVAEEQAAVQAKVAKIQEQLNKKNLGPGVKESLDKTLAYYKKRTDFVSEELAVTHALQKEQNNLKIYQEEIVKPAQRRMEVEKATMDMLVQTGQMSSQEVQRQSLINSLKQLELEYAGQIAEAEKTYNSLQEKGYEQAANDAKKRLDRLIDERNTRVEISKIKIDAEDQAKSLEAGFGRAWQKYRDEASDASKLTEKLMGDVLKGIEDALFNMMSGMKVSFSDLFKSIMNDLKRYLAQQMTKEIGDAILGKSSDSKGGLSSLFGGSKSGDGKSGGSDILGTLGTVGTVAKSYGSEILSWMGEKTGSTTLSGWGASLSGAGADAATDAAAQIASDLGKGASSASAAASSLSSVASYATAAFNVYNSLKTGEGWGATAGSVIGTIFGGPVGSAIGSLVGGLADSAFGSKGGPKQGGNYNAAFTSTGGVVAENMFGGYTPSELDTQMQTTVKDFQKNYSDLVKQLGGVAKDLTINLGGDLDPQGSAGNRVSAQVAVGTVGTGTSDTGQAERALWDASLYSSVSKSVSGDFDAAVKLETSRMLVAALKSSDLPADVAKIFDGIDLSSITQAQIDSLLTQATTAADTFKTNTDTVKQADLDLQAVLSLFNKWQDVFPNFAKASDTAKKAFVDLSGGIDSLSSKMSSYYDNFYTQEEKTKFTWKNITETLNEVGVKVIPKTREEFRKLMESANLSTEGGRALSNALLSIEGDFASVTKAIDAASTTITTTTDKVADTSKQDAIKTAQDALEEARRKVQEAYDRESDSLRTVIDRLTQFQDQIRKFRDSLYLDKTLSPLSNYDKYQFAKSKLEEIQAKALLGDEKALGELEQASRDFLEYSRIYNANNTQYQQDFDAVQEFLNRVQINTKEQIDQAKQQLLKLDKMVEGILTVNASVLTLAQAIAAYQAALAALLVAQGSGSGSTPVPSIPTPTPTPTSPTNGSGTGSGTVTEAIAPLSGYDQVYPVITNAYNEYFGRAARQAEANYWAQSLGNNASTNQVRAAIYAGAISTDIDYMRSVRQGWISTGYQTLFGRQASQTEKDWWYSQLDYSTTSNKVYDMIAAGATGSDLAYLTQNHPWMVNGSHANGLANVPFDGYLAELHQGERVLTKNENNEYSGSTNGFATDVVSPLLKEIAALRAEVKALKQEVSNQGDADRSQRGVIAEAQIKVMQTQAVETIRASNNNL